MKRFEIQTNKYGNIGVYDDLTGWIYEFGNDLKGAIEFAREKNRQVACGVLNKVSRGIVAREML